MCKDFKIKNLNDYHDLYVQSDTQMYEVDFSPRNSMESSLKKTKTKLDLLTDIGMLSMVEKRIRWGICHSVHQYVKANNKYMKDYDENKESS